MFDPIEDAGIVFEREIDPEFAPILLRPRHERVDLILTAQTALSHHDPAVQDDSNRNLFNRQRVLLAGPPPSALPDQETVDRLCARHPVPVALAPVFADVSFAEFVGAALVRLFLDTYNGRNNGDGEGAFSGRERYSRLEARLRHAAVGTATLRQWWDRLCRGMGVGVHPSEIDVDLLELLTVPSGVQQLALRALTDGYRTVVALGRAWHQLRKAQSERYAKAAGQAVEPTDLVPLAFNASRIARVGDAQATVVDVPHVQANTLRHAVLRGPSFVHLAALLGLSPTRPGQGTLPPGAEAIFSNGGNIAAGAKQPADPYALAQQVRHRFPSLDLLGGVTDSFDLGESRVRVAGWLVCRENARALAGTPAEALAQTSVSAFDMLDDVTQTRRASGAGEGQMIFSFEALVQGAAVLCRLDLSPWTGELTRGALVAALDTFAENPVIGGSAARGFARVWVERHDALRNGEAARDAYERYLALNRDTLRAEIESGTLGARAVVIAGGV